MIRYDAIYLVAESPSPHGIFDTPTETQRLAYCTVRSVGMQEFYRAKELGLEPSVVFVLAERADYEGEKVVIWEGRRYDVVRTYINGDAIEITCEEAKRNAGQPAGGS